MPSEEWFHSADWNYFWLPIINIVCVSILWWSSASNARERDKWRREAERLRAIIEARALERR